MFEVISVRLVLREIWRVDGGSNWPSPIQKLSSKSPALLGFNLFTYCYVYVSLVCCYRFFVLNVQIRIYIKSDLIFLSKQKLIPDKPLLYISMSEMLSVVTLSIKA